MAEKKIYKVMYVGGSGIILHHKLSDGRTQLPGNEVIELEDYGDFRRLVATPAFKDLTEPDEVVTEAPASVVSTPTVVKATEPVADAVPAKATDTKA